MGREHKGDCRGTDWARRCRLFSTILGLCTLLSSAFLGVLLEASNRQDLFWSRSDTVALFLVIALGSGISFVGILLLDRISGGRLAAIGRHGIYLILAVGAIQLVPQKFLADRGWPVDATYGAILAVGAAGTAMSAFQWLGNLQSVLWRSAGALAVLFPLLLIHVLRLPPFVVRDDLSADGLHSGGAAAPSVVVLIFDSISMAQCRDENGEWRSDLPAIGDLRSDSVCFDQAVSCGPGTTISLPNFLFQRSPEDYHNNSWDDSWFAVDPASFTNGIFHAAKRKGYRTGMLGYYLPFGQMFGPLLDGAKDVSFSRYFAPDSFWNRCANQAICLLAYARGPFGGGIVAGIPRLRHVPGWLNEGYFMRTVRQTEEITRTYLGSIPPTGHLFVSFMAVPHSPAIFLADGSVDAMQATYDSQLRYADKMLGEFVQAMKVRGTYDACWVIMTSDHGHHGFDLPYAQHRNVPFVVKPPGGNGARLVDVPIDLWELGPFFGAVFGGSDVADCLAEILPEEYPK